MRILIADDDRVSRHMLKATLTRWGYDVVVAKDGAQAWQILQEDDSPQLAVLDWLMPGMDGLEVCRNVRKHGQGGYKYLLVLTSKTRKEDVIEGLKAGADDYVFKPFDAFELEARIRTGRRILDLQEKLHQQASHDALTRLWNRAAIRDLAEREQARIRRCRGSLAIILADIDYFKRINDAHGHAAGDLVLLEVAKRMTLAVRQYDYVGRYGGEEFLILVPNTGLQGAAALAERIRRFVATEPVLVGDLSMPVTASFGVAATEGDAELTLEKMLNDADRALYQAKGKGRNRVEIWQDSPLATTAF